MPTQPNTRRSTSSLNTHAAMTRQERRQPRVVTLTRAELAINPGEHRIYILTQLTRPGRIIRAFFIGEKYSRYRSQADILWGHLPTIAPAAQLTDSRLSTTFSATPGYSVHPKSQPLVLTGPWLPAYTYIKSWAYNATASADRIFLSVTLELS